MTDEEIFAENLKRMMEAKGLNASGLAKLLDSSCGSVMNYLRGTIPNGRTLRRMAQIFGCSMDAFFNEGDVEVESVLKELERRCAEEGPQWWVIAEDVRELAFMVNNIMDRIEALFYNKYCKEADDNRRAAKADFLGHCRSSSRQLRAQIKAFGENVNNFLR